MSGDVERILKTHELFRVTEGDSVDFEENGGIVQIGPTEVRAVVPWILGQLRESAGRRTEAAAAFSRASALVESGEDRLFLARASREDVRERVAWLRRLLARVQ